MSTEAMRSDTYNGNTVHTLLADYQDEANGGNGWLRILKFSSNERYIQVKTYSPTLNQWQTDDDSQFELGYDTFGKFMVEFTAYNDLAWGTGQLKNNITSITSPNGGSGLPSSGTLVDYDAGESTSVTLTITGGSFSPEDASQGARMSSGTDAYEIFSGKVSCLGVISYQGQEPPNNYLKLTLFGMDPNKIYDLAFYGNSGSYGWDRASLVTISGADDFTNKSSVGTDNFGQPLFSGPIDNSTRLPANNTATGYVAYFADVEPGSDGQVVLTISFDGIQDEQYSGEYASALMVKQIGRIQEPRRGYTAYNDLAWGTGQLQTNITRFTSPNGGSELPSSGKLVNYDTGASTDATLTVLGGYFNGSNNANQGAEPASGTDAHNFFNGKLTGLGVISYDDAAPRAGNLLLTLTNLNPKRLYNMVFYGNRSDYSWDRTSLVTVSGATGFVNKSSVGADNFGQPLFSGPSDDSTRLPANNTATGYVAWFADVEPGSDGQVVLTISFDGAVSSQYKGKYASAFMLQEYKFNYIPVADAGPNQVSYADHTGLAEVTLDGSASYDPDGNELTYFWTWTIDGNTFTSKGSDGIINMLDFAALAKQWSQSDNLFADLSILTKAWLSTPTLPNWNLQCDVAPTGPFLTIEMPVGEHIVELIVNDGIDDSEPNYVTVTVIEPMQSQLWISP